MDTLQIVISASVGLVASVITALVASSLTRRQERRKYEIDIATKLAALNSTEDSVTRVFATQLAQGCLVVSRNDAQDKDRVFIPAGCRISVGRGPENHIVIADPAVSKQHAAFRASGLTVYLEPLAPTNGVEVNGRLVSQPKALENGDIVTVPGAHFQIAFVTLSA